MTYSEKLKNPKWQKKRLEIMERDEWTCVLCGNKDKTLNVHHRKYKSGAEPWEYANPELLTLCEDCHEAHHDSDRGDAFNIVDLSIDRLIYQLCEGGLGASYLDFLRERRAWNEKYGSSALVDNTPEAIKAWEEYAGLQRKFSSALKRKYARCLASVVRDFSPQSPIRSIAAILFSDSSVEGSGR